jgi:hypothetical protein
MKLNLWPWTTICLNCSVTRGIAMSVVSGVLLLPIAMPIASVARDEKSVKVPAAVQKISNAQFKIFTKNKVKAFSSRLVEENDKEWVFVYSDLGTTPGPGSDVFVTVEKISGKATAFYGK